MRHYRMLKYRIPNMRRLTSIPVTVKLRAIPNSHYRSIKYDTLSRSQAPRTLPAER